MANRFDLAIHRATGKRLPRVKRTWHYVQDPGMYEISCPKCGTYDLQWSEWDKCVWCEKCQKDIKLTYKNCGVFSGPIPIEVAQMLGMCFDRWDMEKKKFIVFNSKDNEWVYLTKNEYIKYKKNTLTII